MAGAAEILHAALAFATGLWSLSNIPHLGRTAPRLLWTVIAALCLPVALHKQLGHRLVEDRAGPVGVAVTYPSSDLMAAVFTFAAIKKLLACATAWGALRTAAGTPALVIASAAQVLPRPAHVSPASLTAGGLICEILRWVMILTYLGSAMLFAARLSTTRGARSEPGRRCVSTTLVITGTALGLLYAGGHAAIQPAALVLEGRSPTIFDGTIDALSFDIAIVLIVAGTTWGQLTTVVDGVQTTRSARAARRRISLMWPYWAYLVTEVPDAAAWPQDVRTPATDPEQLNFQQNRLVLEIYQCQRQLMPYVSPADRALIAGRVTAAGLHGADAAAAANSICLRMAVLAHQRRRSGAPPAPVGLDEPDLPAGTPDDAANQIVDRLRRLKRSHVRRVVLAVLAETPRPAR